MKKYTFIIGLILLMSPFLSLAQKFNIEFYGHACFVIENEAGKRIMIDPVQLGNYSLPEGTSADVVAVTHLHFDHVNTDAVTGNPSIFYGIKQREDGAEIFEKIDTVISDIHIYNIKANHRDPKENSMLNTIFVFEFDGIRLAHLGDQGCVLFPEQIEAIGEIDVLMIPVGGKYTIIPEQADEVIAQLKPKSYVFPMHYKSEIAKFLPYSIDDFLKGKEPLETIEGNKIKVDFSNPPSSLTYIKMDYK